MSPLMRSLSTLLSLLRIWSLTKENTSDWLLVNVRSEPRNLWGPSSNVSILCPSIVNGIGVDLPDTIERDLHLEGLSFRFIDVVQSCTWAMSFWWVFLLQVMMLKSSANGVVIMGVSEPWNLNPLSLSEVSFSRIGLKMARKIIGLRGSPWNTPLRNLKGSETTILYWQHLKYYCTIVRYSGVFQMANHNVLKIGEQVCVGPNQTYTNNIRIECMCVLITNSLAKIRCSNSSNSESSYRSERCFNSLFGSRSLA